MTRTPKVAGVTTYISVESSLLDNWLAAEQADALLGAPVGRLLRELWEPWPESVRDSATRLARGLVLLEQALRLPLRGTAPQALEPSMAARQSVLESASTQVLAERVDAFLETLGNGLIELRNEVSYQLMPLRRLVARLNQAGEFAGMDPFVAAVARVAPESALVAGYRDARARLEERVRAALVVFRVPPGGTPEERLELATAAVKAVESAYVVAYMFCDPLPRVPLGDFRPLEGEDNALDLLNRAYYRLRGAGIYSDFITAVSHDNLQARADAARFREDLVRQAAREGPLHVLEVGVGGGRFAADFLRACERIGGDRSLFPFYHRLRYVMGDLSPAMLRDALAQQPERDRVQVLGLDELDRMAPYALQRYNELFDDLTQCSILYRDPGGRLYRSEVRGTYPAALLPEGVSPEALADWLDRTDLDALGRLGVEALVPLDFEVRLVPCGADALPLGAFLVELLGDRRDVLFPFPIGGARFLEQSLDRAGDRGKVRIFDYGLASMDSAAHDYGSALQIVRRYGASATRDVLFPLLEAVAHRVGKPTRLVRLEEFIREATGEQPIPVRYLAGIEGEARVTPLCSRGLFPLTALRHHVDLLARAAQGGDYSAFLAEAQARGWVRLGVPGFDAVWAGTLLDRLAVDLDFSLNALFRRHALGLLSEDVPWLTGPAARKAVEQDLSRLGFDLVQVRSVLDRPEFGHFWVLEVG
ncbi:MAG: hypothetical protein AB1758_19295 [Candidatus Eremiobacterota bacterium]